MLEIKVESLRFELSAVFYQELYYEKYFEIRLNGFRSNYSI